MRLNLVLVLLFLSLLLRGSDYSFSYTSGIDSAYQYVYSLQFDKAYALLAQEKRINPENLLVYHIENYIDFFTVFIGEETRDFEKFRANKEQRIQKIKEGDKNSPFYRFCLAEIHLQWALCRSKFKEYLRAGLDVNRAYKLLRENQRLHPDFQLNAKSLSVIHSLIGSVSGVKKSLIKIFTALDGSTSLGLSQIESLYQNTIKDPGPFATEIIGIRALMALHIEHKENLAQNIMKQNDHLIPNGGIEQFLSTTIANQLGDVDEVIHTLTEPRPSDAFPFYYLDFLLGSALLTRFDPSAREYIQSFISNFKGVNYIKEAHQKLAWYELIIENDPVRYDQIIAQCISLGRDLIGEDQAAYEEAKGKVRPHRELLMARLSFDGGLYDTCLYILNHIDTKSLSNEHMTEYVYRRGRCLQKSGNSREAIKHFGHAINLGMEAGSYYSCSAALQMGILFCDMKNDERAKHYFEMCLDISPKEHKESLHQKAIVWLEQLEGHTN